MDLYHQKLLTGIGVIVLLFLGGTMYFSHTEGWSNFDAFYYTGTTLTTLGYGDLVVKTPEAKIASLLLSMMGVALIIYFVLLYVQRPYLEQLPKTRRRT